MTRYETLKDKPKRFLSLTGYTLEEFSALVPYFSKRFLASVETKTLEGKDRFFHDGEPGTSDSASERRRGTTGILQWEKETTHREK